jgi:hypothetical protein
MPRGDRTGPTGLGPLTGRGAGFCAGFKVPGYANLIVGCGLGFGRGRMYKIACLAGAAYLAYQCASRRSLSKQ